MEFSLTLWLFAALPIFVLLLLMANNNIKSVNAVLISLIITVLSSNLIYQLNFRQMWIAFNKGAALSFYVILIIIGAVILYSLVDISGGFILIESFMKSFGGNKALQFIGLSWAFTGFIQGVTGFGFPVAIAGGLLIGIGYKPLISIIAALVGHSWAVSFGSMGSAFFALQLVTGLDVIRLGVTLAIFFYVPILISGLSVAHIYGGFKEVKRNLKYIFPMSILMWTGQLIAAAGNFAHVGALLGGTLGSIYLIIILIKQSDLSFINILNFRRENISIITALFPYIVLISIVFLFQFPFINNLLPDLRITFSFPGFTTGLGYYVEAEESFSSIEIFGHPGFFLVISSLLGGFFYYKRKLLSFSRIKLIFQQSYKKSKSSIITISLLMVMALILNNSGMIFNFAQGIAKVGRIIFPIISPIIGILGAFLTSSNTSSNVLFGAFQINIAELLGFSPEIIASTQSIGGSLGSAIAPAKILLGTSVVGLNGREGEIMRRCFIYTLINGLLIGVVSFISMILFI
ncbi:MAG: L-lactate permease [bacterium]